LSLRPIDGSLAGVLPYGHFVDDGEIYLRGKGLMVGYEMHGMSVEGSSQQETEAQAQRLGRAISYFGSNDMLQCIFQRRPAIDYRERRFPSRAARMIDQERWRQFAEQKYWRTDALLYATTQQESPVQSRLNARFFSSQRGAAYTNFELWRQRFHQRLTAFEDACGLRLMRLDSAEMFRHLILSVTGRDYPAIVPTRTARLNEIISSERWYGGVAPWVGDLHMRPVCFGNSSD
jgi:type IV secretion system protein TrbE